MQPTMVTESLPVLCYDAGKLVAVEHAVLDGYPSFVTAVRLTFESYRVVFRAVPEDDTITVADDGAFPASDELLTTVTAAAPWAGWIGRGVAWAWLLTNQQGYADGIRIEFGTDGSGVTLVVAGSSINLYAFVRVA